MRKHKELTIDCSINLHKRVYGIKFQNRTSRAIKEIKKFAQKIMGVNNIRIDSILNKQLCKNGPKNVPFKIKLRLFKKFHVNEKGLDLWVVYVTLLKNSLLI